jgi:hypothetical protein
MADVVVQGDDNERQRVGEEWLSVVLIEGTCCWCARAGWADREVGDGRAICANGKRLSGQCVCEPAAEVAVRVSTALQLAILGRHLHAVSGERY